MCHLGCRLRVHGDWCIAITWSSLNSFLCISSRLIFIEANSRSPPNHTICPKWHPLPCLVHYLWPEPFGISYGPWPKVVHYIVNRMWFGAQRYVSGSHRAIVMAPLSSFSLKRVETQNTCFSCGFFISVRLRPFWKRQTSYVSVAENGFNTNLSVN